MVAVTTRPAAADDDTSTKPKHGSFWSVTFVGGVLTPLGSMARLHKNALVAGARVAWVHKSGFGLEIATEYSPLPRDAASLQPLETYETHFGVSTIGPRFVLGKDFARVFVSGGGGVAFDYSTHKGRDSTGLPFEESSSDVVPAANLSGGLQLHFMSSGGVVIAGTYTKAFKSATPRKYWALSGGLVFIFK